MTKDEIIAEARLRQIHTLESAIEKRNMRIRSLEKTLGKTSIELLDDNERLSMQSLSYEMEWQCAMRRVIELEAHEPILCANCNDHYERGEKWYCEMCHEPIMASARQLDARVNELEKENAELKKEILFLAQNLEETGNDCMVIARKYLYKFEKENK